MTTDLNAACLAWIRRASRDALAHYITTGQRSPGQPIDLRPRHRREADVLRIHLTGMRRLK